MRRVGIMTVLFVGLMTTGCPKSEPPQERAPAPARQDGPNIAGPVAYIELDGGQAIVRDGKIERVTGIEADVLVPGRDHVAWLFDHGRVRRLKGGVADRVGTLADRLGFVHRQPDGRMVMSNAETGEVQLGQVKELWRVGDGSPERWALPPGITKVKDGRITGDTRVVLTEDLLLVDRGQGFVTHPLPEPSGFPGKSLAVAADGTILVATKTAVWRLGQKEKGPPFVNLLRTGAKLLSSPDGVVYAQDPLHIHRYDDGELKPIGGLGLRSEHFGVGLDGTIAAQLEGGRAMVVMTPDGKTRRIPAQGELAFPLAFEDLVVGDGQIWAISPHGLVVAEGERVHHYGRNVAPALDADVRRIAVDGKVKLPDVGPPKTIRVEGSITRDGKPVANTSVQACTVAVTTLNDGPPCSEEESRFIARGTRSDATGNFVFEALPPGTWQLAFAYQGGWKVRLRRPCGDTKPGETCKAGDIGAR